MTGYRTVIFNLVLAVIALFRMFFPDVVLPADDEINKIFEAIWAVIAIGGNLGMRIFVTKGPVGVKDPECK